MAFLIDVGPGSNFLVNTIVDGGVRWASGSTGTGTVVLVNYSGAGARREPDYTAGYEDRAFASAFEAFEAVADIRFLQSPAQHKADLRLETGTSEDFPYELGEEGNLGAMYTPYQVNLGGLGGQSLGVFNIEGYGWNRDGLQEGGYGYLTILHELGHGLGFTHPFEREPSGLSTRIADGVAAYPLTVMAYNGYSLTGGYLRDVRDIGSDYEEDFGYFGSLSPLDIAGIQSLYGANAGRSDTDGDGRDGDRYYLPQGNMAGTYWTTVWDTGGVDWIIHSGTAQSRISLIPFDFSRAAERSGFQAGDWHGGISQVRGVEGGFMIADDFTGVLDARQGGFHGVLIENAKGGQGRDRITGNDARNELFGRGGADVVRGEAGSDRLLGGTGDDLLRGGDGADALNGGRGADAVFGGRHGDLLRGSDGDDSLNGNSGNDLILGGRGDDRIRGSTGDDELHGGSGADLLPGDRGSDRLHGGSGPDVFRFGSGMGRDVIADFTVEDVVDLVGHPAVGGFSRFLRLGEDRPGRAVFDLDDDVLVLAGVQIADLLEQSFIF